MSMLSKFLRPLIYGRSQRDEQQVKETCDLCSHGNDEALLEVLDLARNIYEYEYPVHIRISAHGPLFFA